MPFSIFRSFLKRRDAANVAHIATMDEHIYGGCKQLEGSWGPGIVDELEVVDVWEDEESCSCSLLACHDNKIFEASSWADSLV